MDLNGKIVFVTGGARGIGLDAAQRVYAQGARIVLVDVDEALAESEAGRLGDRALGIGADVTDQIQLDAAVARAVSRFGRIDVVVANAGVAPPVETVRTGSPEAFDRVLDVNLHGVVNTVRATLTELERTRGYLIIVSSLYAVMNGALSTPYAMSKAAIEALGRSLRVELSGTGVDVGVAYFGFIDTKLVQDAFDKPGIPELRAALRPRFLADPVPVAKAGVAMAEGIRTRASRVTAPRWVRATLPLRGLLHYLDAQFVRDAGVRKAVDAAEAATRD